MAGPCPSNVFYFLLTFKLVSRSVTLRFPIQIFSYPPCQAQNTKHQKYEHQLILHPASQFVIFKTYSHQFVPYILNCEFVATTHLNTERTAYVIKKGRQPADKSSLFKSYVSSSKNGNQ